MRRSFEQHYSASGTWAKFFRKSPAFVETLLIKDKQTAGRYLTIDIWEGIGPYQRFKNEHAREYKEIDRMCEELTTMERAIGVLEAVPFVE
ncbi:MAG TPA: hypothetical protein VFG11_07985 [Acidobacteriota bacterium]|nr:hypothetical protein [Acidobacteriota bacterium]